MYLTIKQIKDQYNVSEKTIRRLYEKTPSNPNPIIKEGQRVKGYKNKKGRWVINSDLVESLFADKRKTSQENTKEQVKEQSKTSQTESQVLLATIKVLQSQLETKDKQIESLTKLTDQQQQLTSQLQNQLLIASPNATKEPIVADIQAKTTKNSNQAKKPVKKAVRKPQTKNKATKPKKKHWWQRSK